jgi:hypothetical protein
MDQLDRRILGVLTQTYLVFWTPIPAPHAALDQFASNRVEFWQACTSRIPPFLKHLFPQFAAHHIHHTFKIRFGIAFNVSVMRTWIELI